MRHIPTRAWILAVVSGVLQAVIFPQPGLYFLGWIAVAPLLFALLRGRGGEGDIADSEGRSLRVFRPAEGFWIGYASGVVWYLGSCYWVYHVMHTYGGLSAPVSIGLLVLFCLYLGLYHGLFGALLMVAHRRSHAGNRRALLVAPFLWVAVEMARARITFPWNLLGTSQVDNIPLATMATVTGVYGLSFAILLVNAAFTAALLLPRPRRTNILITAGAAAIALQVGVLADPEPFPAAHRARLVQQNVPILASNQWTADYFDRTMAELAQLSGAKANFPAPGDTEPPPVENTGPQISAGPGLIIWPESPAPFFTSDPKFYTWMHTLARHTRSYLIVGSLGVRAAGERQRPSEMMNSAAIFSPSGEAAGRYDKLHLVPFGEYIPFKSLLVFAKKLTREVGDFIPGTERSVFDLDAAHVGVFICYESVFPDEVREFADRGATVLVNISNDGWFGDTGAPGQHLNMARMRAVENHRWVLRATNTGITAAIDPQGRVVARAPQGQRTALDVRYGLVTYTTFYTRHGDVFAYLCVIISVLGVFARFRFAAETMIEARTGA